MNAVQKQQANYTSDKKYKKEGSIHVDTDPRDSKKNKKFGGGEYIDYEIIK